MSLHDRNVLISFNTTCHVRNMSPYIPLSVDTSTSLVNYVPHNVSHVQRPKCVSFKSKVSVTSNFKRVSLSLLYTIFVAILFNTFSFTQSTNLVYFLDYLYICESLKIAWLIHQSKFTFTLY